MHRSTLMHWMAAAIFLSASALAGAATVSAKPTVAVPYAANSLAAAVTAAEKRLQGQRVGVDDVRQQDGRWVYEIEVRNGSNVFDVEVEQSLQRPRAGLMPMTTNPISTFQIDVIMVGPWRSADVPTG